MLVVGSKNHDLTICGYLVRFQVPGMIFLFLSRSRVQFRKVLVTAKVSVPTLSQGFTDVNRQDDQGNSIKDNIELGLDYRFRDSVHYHQGRILAASRQGWYRRS